MAGVNRRAVLLTLGSIPIWLPQSARPATTSPAAPIGQIEARVGGRIGVYALDTSSGQTVGHRADERFAMCSTFKWLLAAQLLASVDRGRCGLEDDVAYDRGDLLAHAPVTSRHVGRGRMTLQELAEAAVTVSDNTAANLLLRRLGGPAAITAFARSLGDPATRLDRIEPELNSNARNDPRDTTTPRGMVASLRSALAGDALSAGSRKRLLGWLVACETGRDRLRAGMPTSWTVGDKTGAGANNAVNDVAVALPPDGRPIFVASYMSESRASLEALNAAHAEVARTIVAAFGRANVA